MVDLIHFSKKPLTQVYDVAQNKRAVERGDKPDGLWVSYEDGWGWSDWCKSENWGACDYANKITLARDANILWVHGMDALMEFHRQWVKPDTARRRWSMEIRWPEIAEKYDGVFIAPYVWDLRLSDEVGWYYGWDCASGCIWKSRAIESIKTMPYSFEQAA